MFQPIPSQWSNCFYDLIFHLIKFLREPFVFLIKFLLNYLILSNSIFDLFLKNIDTFFCFNFVQFCNFFFPLPFYLCGLQQLYFSIPSFFFFLLFLHSPYLYLFSIFHCLFCLYLWTPNILFLFLLFFLAYAHVLFFFPPSLVPCFVFCVCVCELIIFSFPLSLCLLSFRFSLLLLYFSLLNLSLFGLLFAFLSLCLSFFACLFLFAIYPSNMLFLPSLVPVHISLTCFFHHHYYALLLNYFICIFVFLSMYEIWEVVCS